MASILTKSKQSLQDGKCLVAHWHSSGCPMLAERVTATNDYDVLIVDCQHGPIDVACAAAIMASTRGASPWVRLRDFTPAHIGHLIDAGALGIIAPLIETVDDARELVRASMYPPQGTRSFGPFRAELLAPDYFARANDSIMRWAMIETASAFEARAEIAAVPGIDGLFIGPSDLALALGVSPPSGTPTDARVVAAIESVRAAAHAAGKYAGIFCGDGAYAGKMAAQGFNLVIAGTDLGIMSSGAAHELAAARAPMVPSAT